MSKLPIPSTSDGLQEILHDHKKVEQYFSQGAVANGDTAEYVNALARDHARRNPEMLDEIRTQVQSVAFDVLRESGLGAKPKVNLVNGKPQLSAEGSAVITKGKGAMYNRHAPGAEFERQYQPEDRFSSIGEYLTAIREEARPSSRANRASMLAKLENIRQFQNSFGEEDPGAGGFLVPEIMRSELLQLALEESLVRSRATVIPMNTLRVPVPTVDDTSHTTSLFGGVQFYWAEEGASLTESQATFGRVVLDAKKLTGFFKVPNELLADAPAFSAWFDSRIPAGLAWFEDLYFLRGTGSGEPQGFIGSPAYITIDRAVTNQISYADLVTIYARMLPQSHANSCWIASIDSFPQLAQLTLSTPGIWMGGYNASRIEDAPPISIFGRPVYFTEKVPSTTISGGASGDISLVDLSYYLIGDRQTVSVASSDQFLFQNDQMAFRLIERVDGRPWLQSALTPHNNGSTLSAYVGTSATHT